MPRNGSNGVNSPGIRLFTRQSLDAYIKSICDILRRSNCAGALQYVPELTWILFLRILDEREQGEHERAEAVGAPFTSSLEPPYRWRDWAAPEGPKRKELQDGALGAFFDFVNGELIPYLKTLREHPGVGPRQKIISEIMSGVERTRVDTEKNFLDVLDKVDAIRSDNVDVEHIFALSQVYEGLLLRMGEKNNDGGQFFTPRQIIRAMTQVVDPRPGQTVYDPCCGTAGFLVQAFEYMQAVLPEKATGRDLEMLGRESLYGREKENLIYPIALANMVLHGIDEPHIWHGNTLTGAAAYGGGLFHGAPELYDVVLTNPPFGGKENQEAQAGFEYKTSATQVLFLQHIMKSLKRGGRCGIVLDEGVLFRTNEGGFVNTKKKLINEYDLWCIVSMPPGVFSAAGAGVKTNLVFFNRPHVGESATQAVWYYDLSDLKVGKKTPFTLDHMEEFFRLLPGRGNSRRSWTVPVEELRARSYDLKAVNPNPKSDEDTRPPEELLDLIETKGMEVLETLRSLRETMASR